MKKTFLFILLFFVAYGAFAKTPYATVQGVYKAETEKQIFLYEVIDGKLSEYASTRIGADGTFAFTLIPQNSQFYYIGNETNYYRVYLQPDEVLNVSIDNDKDLISFVGKYTKESQLVINWWKMVHEVEVAAVKRAGMRTIYTEFYPLLSQTVKEYEKFRKQVKTSDKQFDENFVYLIDSDIRYYALEFLSSGRIKHPEKGNITDFHKQLLNEKILCTDLLKLPYAWIYADAFISVSKAHLENIQQDRVDYTLDQVEDPHFRSVFITNELVALQSKTEQCLHFFNAYGKYLSDPKHKNIVAGITKKFEKVVPGRKAIDFTYPDVNGKFHSLSDYKGKVVVVDVWATWCGPCMHELPFFRKLEKEYHDNENVVFVGVSMDNRKSVWENYVKKERLEGVQLLGDQHIRENYKIHGIPRFMIIDAEGNIVTTDAPRPSTPRLKKMIDEELNKK